MSHANYSSKKNKQPRCPVRCSTDVELDLDVKQRVECREISRRGTEFDVEVEFEIDHDCKLIPKKNHKESEDPCKVKCEFKVALDFKCHAKVKHNPCQRPEALFELDVELDVKPNCKPIEDCKIRYYKKDNKQY